MFCWPWRQQLQGVGCGLVFVRLFSLQINFFYILILQPGARLSRLHSLCPFPECGAAAGDPFPEGFKAFRTCLFLLGLLEAFWVI